MPSCWVFIRKVLVLLAIWWRYELNSFKPHIYSQPEQVGLSDTPFREHLVKGGSDLPIKVVCFVKKEIMFSISKETDLN